MSRLPIEQIIANYEIIINKNTNDIKEIVKLAKEIKKLEPQNNLAIKIQQLEINLISNKELLQIEIDQEMKEMLEFENKEIIAELPLLEAELLNYLAPTDDRDDNNILLEIRAGAGGDESALFASDIYKAYSRMCEALDLKIKVSSTSSNDLGGFREIIAEIRGDMAFAWFKYEGGVHRVQRVPATEKQGRIHTSTASVAIMPLIDDDSEFRLDMKEVEVVASTSQGAGGQSVNTTYSAIKTKHLPTGIEAQCQDERNQGQNKVKALQILTSRVYNYYEEIRMAKEIAERRDQVGNADRSEKIRTYNYPQDRVTDHRYNKSWNNLPDIMNGGIVRCIKEIKSLEAERILNSLN